MSDNATTITLRIYIDESLVVPDGLGNLTLARQVAGVSNVVFQSKTSEMFSVSNDFAWDQAFKIGATAKPAKPGALVHSSTTLRPIEPGWSCDWKGPDGKTLMNMPPAKLDPTFSDDKSMFGTLNEPEKWHNSIWCKVGTDYKAIYQDTKTIKGLGVRGYSIENIYQLSWESDTVVPGVLAKAWSRPWKFSMTADETIRYLSWGPDTPGGAGASWFNYGSTDPGKHDPSLATLDAESLVPEQPKEPADIPAAVSFKFGWTDPKLSSLGRKRNANSLLQYLSTAIDGYVSLVNVSQNDGLRAVAVLNPYSTFGDTLPGETDADKVVIFLRGLLAFLSPEVAPTVIDWNAGGITLEAGVLTYLAELTWSGLGAVGKVASKITELTNKLKAAVPGKEVEFSKVVHKGGDKYETKASGKGLTNADITLIIKAMQAFSSAEPTGELTVDVKAPVSSLIEGSNGTENGL